MRLLLAAQAFAARVPAGTELSVRLVDKVATETTKPSAAVHATVIAPVIVEGAIAIPAGAQLDGTVKQVKAATDNDPAQLELVFTEIHDGAVRAKLSAVVAALDNARESVDDKGVITGISPSDTSERAAQPGNRRNFRPTTNWPDSPD